MHKIIPTYRRIADAELPTVRDLETDEDRAATADELLNLGLVHIVDDVYSCIEQHRRDPETLAWAPVGAPHPGIVLAAGDVTRRHAQLPADVRGKVLRAEVIRSPDPAVNVLELAEANLLEQQDVIEEIVGDVDGKPLIDFEQPTVLVLEGRRLAALPDSDIAQVRVPMDDVGRTSDIVIAENLPPHAWAGERMP